MLEINKAFCLCLDKRQGEWLDLEKQCLSKGIPFEKFIVGDGLMFQPCQYDRIDETEFDFDSWEYGNDTTKLRHYNAFKSHQEIVKKAKSENLDRILILEDDAYFTERFDDVITKLSSQIEKMEFDMLFLGWWIGEEDDAWNEVVEELYHQNGSVGIGKVSEAHFTCGGLHGVIINSTMFDAIIEMEPTNPIDAQLNRNFHEEIKSYYIMPKIIHDKGIFSNCEQNTIARKKL